MSGTSTGNSHQSYLSRATHRLTSKPHVSLRSYWFDKHEPCGLSRVSAHSRSMSELRCGPSTQTFSKNRFRLNWLA